MEGTVQLSTLNPGEHFKSPAFHNKEMIVILQAESALCSFCNYNDQIELHGRPSPILLPKFTLVEKL